MKGNTLARYPATIVLPFMLEDAQFVLCWPSPIAVRLDIQGDRVVARRSASATQPVTDPSLSRLLRTCLLSTVGSTGSPRACRSRTPTCRLFSRNGCLFASAHTCVDAVPPYAFDFSCGSLWGALL